MGTSWDETLWQDYLWRARFSGERSRGSWIVGRRRDGSWVRLKMELNTQESRSSNPIDKVLNDGVACLLELARRWG